MLLRGNMAQFRKGAVARAVLAAIHDAFSSGVLPAAYASINRTGLATRTGPDGLVGYGPHNLQLHSADQMAASWSALGAADATATDAHTVAFSAVGGARNAAAVSLNVGDRVAFSAVLSSANLTSVYLQDAVHGAGILVLLTTTPARHTLFFTTPGTFASFRFSSTDVGSLTVTDCIASIVNSDVTPEYIPTTAAALYPPRITYDPTTLECLGALFESQGANLLGQSENLSAWTHTNVSVTPDALLAPDGSVTADAYVLPAGTLNREAYRQSAVSAATVYQFHIYSAAGADGSGWYEVALVAPGMTVIRSFFNARTGEKGAGPGTLVLGNSGFYRLVVPFTTVGGGTATIYLSARPGNNSPTLETGAGGVGAYFWGSGLEAAAAPTSYIPNPTTGSAVRPADPIVLSGSAFTERFGDGSDFVMALEFTSQGPKVGRFVEICGASDRFSTTGGIVYDGHYVYFFAPGATVIAQLAASATAGVRARIAFSHSAGKFRASFNGGTVLTSTAGTVTGPMGRAAIGGDVIGGQRQNHIVHDAEFKPGQGSTMSDAALQALSAL